MRSKKKFEVVVMGFSEQLNRCLTEVVYSSVNYRPTKKEYKDYVCKVIDGDIKFDMPVEICLYKTSYVEDANDYIPDDEPLMVCRINAIKPGRPRKVVK